MTSVKESLLKLSADLCFEGNEVHFSNETEWGTLQHHKKPKTCRAALAEALVVLAAVLAEILATIFAPVLAPVFAGLAFPLGSFGSLRIPILPAVLRQGSKTYCSASLLRPPFSSCMERFKQTAGIGHQIDIQLERYDNNGP